MLGVPLHFSKGKFRLEFHHKICDKDTRCLNTSMKSSSHTIHTIMAKTFIAQGDPLVEFDGTLSDLKRVADLFDAYPQGTDITKKVSAVLNEIVETEKDVSEYDAVIVKVGNCTVTVVNSREAAATPFTDLSGMRDYTWKPTLLNGQCLWYHTSQAEYEGGWMDTIASWLWSGGGF